jgi:hypothetical protein
MVSDLSNESIFEEYISAWWNPYWILLLLAQFRIVNYFSFILSQISLILQVNKYQQYQSSFHYMNHKIYLDSVLFDIVDVNIFFYEDDQN